MQGETLWHREKGFACSCLTIRFASKKDYDKKAAFTDLLSVLVGKRGFEPPTPASRTLCSTRLSHFPTRIERFSWTGQANLIFKKINGINHKRAFPLSRFHELVHFFSAYRSGSSRFRCELISVKIKKTADTKASCL